VALSRKETCNLRHPMHLRHPVLLRCMFTYTYNCIHLYTNTCMNIPIYKYVYIHIQVCKFTPKCMNLYIYNVVIMYVYIYISVYTYLYKNACINISIYYYSRVFSHPHQIVCLNILISRTHLIACSVGYKFIRENSPKKIPNTWKFTLSCVSTYVYTTHILYLYIKHYPNLYVTICPKKVKIPENSHWAWLHFSWAWHTPADWSFLVQPKTHYTQIAPAKIKYVYIWYILL